MTELVTFAAARFSVDPETRTLSGMLLPFGEVSAPAMDGRQYTFSEGEVEVLDPETDSTVLNYGHDLHTLNMQVGAASKLTIGQAGVEASFGIADTAEGNTILSLAGHKPPILRAFSAELEGEFEPDDNGVMHVKPGTTATVTGGAVVRRGAFAGAAITSVAASAAQTERNTMTETTETPQVVSFTADQAEEMRSQIAALSERVDGLADIKAPVVQATAQLSVTEEPIYRFAGSERAPSGFDFAEDLLAAGVRGDAAALERVRKFSLDALKPRFAADGVVKTGDTAATNQPTYRPEMFLGQAPVPASPLYDFFHKGSISSVQPFFWSKLDRANTTVNVHDHTEGVEPAADDIATVTVANVTPAPVSGKVHITREVGDQGGNPQVSGLVWSEFDRSLKIALETKTFALVSAAMGSVTALATIATGTTGVNAGLAVEGGLIDLQFDPDGSRIARLFGHRDLYKALGQAVNGNSEKVYPIKAPTNRDGSFAEKYTSLDIAGYSMFPAASLGVAGGTKNSIAADPIAVHVWNSALQRLEKLKEDVEGWDLGCFAYFAGVVYDTAGLRKITYTP